MTLYYISTAEKSSRCHHTKFRRLLKRQSLWVGSKVFPSSNFNKNLHFALTKRSSLAEPPKQKVVKRFLKKWFIVSCCFWTFVLQFLEKKKNFSKETWMKDECKSFSWNHFLQMWRRQQSFLFIFWSIVTYKTSGRVSLFNWNEFWTEPSIINQQGSMWIKLILDTAEGSFFVVLSSGRHRYLRLWNPLLSIRRVQSQYCPQTKQ